MPTYCITSCYKNVEGARFDFDYYLNAHFKLIERLMADHGLISLEVNKSLSKLDNSRPEVICTGRAYFSTLDALLRGIELHREELGADIIKYTDLLPEVHISEVLLKHTVD